MQKSDFGNFGVIEFLRQGDDLSVTVGVLSSLIANIYFLMFSLFLMFTLFFYIYIMKLSG